MKLIISTLMLSLFAFSATAQDYSGAFEETTTSKKPANEYYPKAGEVGIGFDATPFLDYLGNSFNGTQNNSLNLGKNTLYFRYFLSDDAALRVALKINSTKDVDNFYVADDAAQILDPLSRNQLQDRSLRDNNNYGIGIGYQMFKGTGRFRAFYGGDVIFGMGNSLTQYEYGNSMTEINPSPTTEWGRQAERTLELKGGNFLQYGVNGVVGVEYYIAPKFAIGLETGLTYSQTIWGQSSAQVEKMVVSQHVTENKQLSPGDRYRDFATTYHGNLYFMIYF